MVSWADESGYPLDSPKHPTFFERHAEAADLRRKMLLESGRPAMLPPITDGSDPGDESDYKDAA